MINGSNHQANKIDSWPGEHEILFVATSDCLPSHPTNNDGRSTDSCFALIGAKYTTLTSPTKGETAACGSGDFIPSSQRSILLPPGQVGVYPVITAIYHDMDSPCPTVWSAGWHNNGWGSSIYLLCVHQFWSCYHGEDYSRHHCIHHVLLLMLNQVSILFVYIGPANCSAVSLTASRLTADSLVVSWVIGSCRLGALPRAFYLSWHPIGKQISTTNHTTINSSGNSYYTITGLSPHTEYVIGFAPIHHYCGGTGQVTAISKTGDELQPCMNSSDVLRPTGIHGAHTGMCFKWYIIAVYLPTYDNILSAFHHEIKKT